MKKIGLIIFLVGIFAVFAEQTIACSCMVSEPPKKTFDYSKWLSEHKGAVFLGKVISIEENKDSYLKKVRFEIERHWKGIGEKSEVIIETAYDSAACGVNYENGKKYFVAAFEHDDRLTTDLCSQMAFQGRETEFQKRIKGKEVEKLAAIPALPLPHANNAVGSVIIKGKTYIFSFAGLTEGKTWKDVSKSAYMFVEGETSWRILPDLPVKLGRLAASAQGVRGKVYIFGGYTVAENGDEKSTPEVFRFDPKRMKYEQMKDMPTPVDDMVTFTYKDRFIYLVSGWHDDGNVSLVQIYDTKKNTWTRGTDYPGKPVFGHAGGIVGNKFVIADGVAVVGKNEKGSRIFETINEGWMGTIDPKDRTKINYRRLPQLPGKGHYRMGGVGDSTANQVIFVGGTDNAYNFNGVGYNGVPSKPSAHVFAWDFTKDSWVAFKDKPVASMDHRGLVKLNGDWYTIGGLDQNREVFGDVLDTKR